ncbi:GntR family transcriptional regulator [Marinobacterium lutimaris]|uniref:Transcriptional regulator, GntR family n=1 Tax=Marinobacterium lutimaris TaxID=568106 RepID=A0A1H6CQQ8_9GAMM|nr:GntR family transcriptional regulator [Marinobacterium lutimaris]SEG75127.1 transcriptional regulator, GntR family [Marinobacterium lutimaris]
MSQATPAKLHSIAAAKIRELILRGELAPGERITEAALAERLGLSRTPIRQALPRLAKDGLLIAAGKRGYAVRTFTKEECRAALETRTLLEGMAARMIADKGLSQELDSAFQDCLDSGDAIVASKEIHEAEENAYGEMNDRFHQLIIEGSDTPLLAELVNRCNVVPFASPLQMVFSSSDLKLVHDDLIYAHRQHHFIVEALRRGEGSRAEMLVREHGQVQRHSMNL